MTVQPLSTPLLATIPRVELGEVGVWNISNISGWSPTVEDFHSAVAALDCPAVRRPVLKIGHTGEQGQGDPTIGFVDNMAVAENGMLLVGDFAGVPGWMADVDDSGQFVLKSAYASRSGEWEHNYVCQLGHVHPFVLHAMALLGVVRPGIGTLQDLHDLYTTAPEPLMPAASTLPQSAATPEDVRYAYYTGPGTSWDLWIREMYIDPPELIVENDADRTLLRVPYTIAADGTVEFGDAQTVTVQYVAARAATPNTRQVAFASKTEARPTPTPKTPAAAPAPGTAASGGDNPKEEVGMPDTLIEGLRKQLGLADDADEATVQAALAEALEERADTTTTTETTTTTTEAPAEVTIPEGMVLLPAAALSDLQEGAKTAKQLAQTAHANARKECLDGNASKFLPNSRAAWEKQYDIDPAGTAKYLSEAPEIVPVTEAGHAKDDTAEDDSWFDGVGSPIVKVG